MVYNGAGTRVQRTEGSTTNNYSRAGVSVTSPLLADSGASYTPGISERRGSTTTYSHSGLKNMDTQTGPSQTVTASRKYDAYGNVRSSTGTWQGPFGHAGGFGYQSNDRSGLQLLGHRYYDPETGRFLSTDPIKDGMNWQSYGGGIASPLGSSDPSGLYTSLHNPRNAQLLRGFKDLGMTLGKPPVVSAPKPAPSGWLGKLLRRLKLVGPVRLEEEDPDLIKVYRVGEPGGRYWSREDPRQNPNWFQDYGMKHEDNPGNTITEGYIRESDHGVGWIEYPTTDYNDVPLGNSKLQIRILGDPWSVVVGQTRYPWNPHFFK